MTLPLTFLDKKLIHSALVGPDGAVHYTLTTTRGLMSRKETTISAASGLTGVIYWKDKKFEINGVQRRWDDIERRVGGLLIGREYEWDWGGRPYTLKYQDRHKELLAVPKFAQNSAGIVRFTPYHPRLLHDSEPAVIYFPFEMQDEFERMFLLMAVLRMDIKRQDAEAAASAAGGF